MTPRRTSRTLRDPMIGLRALLVHLSAFVCLLSVASADDAAPSAPDPSTGQWIVLRNGETLRGSLSKQGDRYVIAIEGGEIRLAAREVDFVCESLDEAYQVQRRRQIGGRIDDHLALAEWSLRHGLHGYAAQQISAAMAIDARNRRLARLDDRLQEAMQRTDGPPPQETVGARPKVAAPLRADDLDRFARSLPGDTLEQFTTKIQPLLANHCATAGCHGAASASSYSLIRPPQRKTVSRHLTLRNLHSTLERVNFNQPDQSALLVAARAPHAACGKAALGDEESKQYEDLRDWVRAAVGRSAVASAAGSTGKPTVSAGPEFHPANLDANSTSTAADVR